MLINLTMVIISQPLLASKYHAVHFYINYYFVSHTLTELEMGNNAERTLKTMRVEGSTRKSKDTEGYQFSAKSFRAQLRFADCKKKKSQYKRVNLDQIHTIQQRKEKRGSRKPQKADFLTVPPGRSENGFPGPESQGWGRSNPATTFATPPTAGPGKSKLSTGLARPPKARKRPRDQRNREAPDPREEGLQKGGARAAEVGRATQGGSADGDPILRPRRGKDRGS